MRLVRRLLLLAILVAVGLIALVALTSNTYRVSSPSMEPTLRCAKGLVRACTGNGADRILVSRALYRFRDPHRGDVVAYRPLTSAILGCGLDPKNISISRIVAEPGE